MDNHFVWIDLEMTGLDVKKNTIIEIAAIITDVDLNVVAEGPNIVIHQKEELLENLDPWVMKTHSESGLFEKVRKSKVSLSEAKKEIMFFLQRYVKEKTAPLCGNSIGTDRAFLKEYMPELESFFHYRNLDISSLKILYQNWAANKSPFSKINKHRALDDIKESIEELRYYRESFLKCDK